MKERLTTQDFAKSASKYAYLHDKIVGNSFTYTDVNGGFNVKDFEEHVNAHSKYTIENLADLEEVTQKIVGDLKSTNALFKVSLVTIG